MNFIKLSMIALLMLAGVGSSSTAQHVPKPGSAYQVMMAVAIFAGREAELAVKRGKSQDALVWHFWSGLFEYGAYQMPATATWADALQASINFCAQLESLYTQQRQPTHARLYRAMNNFYRDLWDQLAKSPIITARFPKEMLVPVAGAPGTPWDPRSFEIIQFLAMMKGTGWQAPATPSADEVVCPTCAGAKQWRCRNCLGGGAAGYLKDWTGNPVSDTSYDRGRTGFISKSCYNCNGIGWVKCTRCYGRGVVRK
ncbi:MAG TPA: hypothetical protein VM328_12850 [Fimbriimonadaceae bacterium]|nr:hypothetical protein [Fimbriimonadaceae bacterium]